METTENIKAQFQSGTVSEVRKNLFGFLYQPTGSRIRYHEASIDQKDASQLTRFLEQHDPALLRGIRLQPGMTLAVEPMISAGTWEVEWLDDDWTVVTADDSLAAH
ncbi:MAG: hypothetical protein IKN37_00950, partial [Bacteroidales bacterium]|nr:hypothetical protein [Bacteroidales bacterium]